MSPSFANKARGSAASSQHKASSSSTVQCRMLQHYGLRPQTKFLELWNGEEVHDETAIPNSKNRHNQAIQEKL